MRVSLRHVAEHAGVSRVTASNVIRGKAGEASAETQQRVIKAMRALNYVPVPPPVRQSGHVTTRVIGLLFDYVDMGDIWGLRTYEGLRQGAQEHGYDLLTLLRQMPDDLIDSDLRFLDRRSDGLVFIGPRGRTSVLKTLVKHQIPVVSCYIRDVPPGVAVVDIDDADAMRQSVQHLIENGHRHIMHLGSTQTRIDFRLRRQGYEEAMKAAGLEPLVITETAVDEGVWQMQVLPAIRNHKITAIACANDVHALDVWRYAKESGISVPGQLSLVGMDDLPAAAEGGLTTVQFSGAGVGRAAIDVLVDLMQGNEPPAQPHTVAVTLMQRRSVAPPCLKPLSAALTLPKS